MQNEERKTANVLAGVMRYHGLLAYTVLAFLWWAATTAIELIAGTMGRSTASSGFSAFLVGMIGLSAVGCLRDQRKRIVALEDEIRAAKAAHAGNA